MKPYYEKAGSTLYCARWEEALPTLDGGSFDLVITSPPYNLREGQEHKGGLRVEHSGSRWARGHLAKGYDGFDDALPYEDYVAWQHRFLREAWRLIGEKGAIFYNHKPRHVRGELRLPTALNPALPLRDLIYWNRGSGLNAMSGAFAPWVEWLMVFAKPGFRLRDKAASSIGNLWTIQAELNTPHPCPFPQALVARILATTKARTVLDPHAGKGTTLVVAKRNGLRAVGIEPSEAYCEIASEWLERTEPRAILGVAKQEVMFS